VTGWIAGATSSRRGPKYLNPLYQGSNQTGLRALNERLVLSVIRIHGQLSKTQIADITGLTVQTASVIVRSLDADGLLVANDPIRGKVGQPSVPVSLNPEGALFLGVVLGRRVAELVVVDFLGRILREWDSTADLTDVKYMGDLLLKSAEQMLLTLTADQTARLQGVGIAVPANFGIDDYRGGSHNGPSGEAYDLLDRLAVGIGQRLDIPVYVQNEAVASCSSELVYGHGKGIPNFVYLHVADIIDGGLVQLGGLQFVSHPWPAGMGRMLVPGPGGRLMPLANLPISIWSGASDLDDRRTLQTPPTSSDQSIVDLAIGLSHALHAASAIATVEACVIDGVMPPTVRRQVVQAVKLQLCALNAGTKQDLPVHESLLPKRPVALGAACLPLLSRFFINAERASNSLYNVRGHMPRAPR
jgi:hypothetical protein